jgi:hypothetical protein
MEDSMSRENVLFEQRLRAAQLQVPTFDDVREQATAAVAQVTDEIGVELPESAIRAIALATVAAIENPIEVRGLDRAHHRVAAYVADFLRLVISPATEAATRDPEATARLNIHQEYYAGMRATEADLAQLFVARAEQINGQAAPTFVVPPVVPIETGKPARHAASTIDHTTDLAHAASGIAL